MKSLENNNFLVKAIRALLSKDQNNKLSHFLLYTVLVSISILDENIKYSKSNTKNIGLRVKSLRTSKLLVNGNQTSVY